jgi:hypothetical protein
MGLAEQTNFTVPSEMVTDRAFFEVRVEL